MATPIHCQQRETLTRSIGHDHTGVEPRVRGAYAFAMGDDSGGVDLATPPGALKARTTPLLGAIPSDRATAGQCGRRCAWAPGRLGYCAWACEW